LSQPATFNFLLYLYAMTIASIIAHLETIAPPQYQESYDNAGLLTGSPGWDCTGILCTLDATEAVVQEAVSSGCNLIVAHHPIIFGGLKRLTGSNYVQQTVIAAIKNDIAIYAIHTNLDNVIHGVSGRMAQMLGLQHCRILAPKSDTLKKIVTFVPEAQAEQVRTALFAAGAGQIGHYTECSFNSSGTGTFKGNEGATPFVGTVGQRHYEPEWKIEAVFAAAQEQAVVRALRAAHPYEEPAFDVISLGNPHPGIGSGLVGELPEPVAETDFLSRLKTIFRLPVLRHTPLTGRGVQRVALCGGAGSFLISKALGAGADFYITADVKYHEFFDANGRMVIADIGHYESEQFTVDLLFELLQKKFPTFAVRKSAVKTNPVNYF
jgi:dinuclear metal center YbgI/SA1388 family protein